MARTQRRFERNTGSGNRVWLGHYDLSDLLGINFARFKKNLAVYDNAPAGTQTAWTSHSDPQIVQIGLAQTIPQEDTASVLATVSEIRAKVRQFETGVNLFNDSDFMTYILNTRSIVSLYYHAKRIYEAAMTEVNYSQAGHDTVLAGVAGFNIGSSFTDVANLTDVLGTLKSDINALKWNIRSNFFLKMDVIERAKWLFSKVLKDDSTVKASYYVYLPTSVGVNGTGPDPTVNNIPNTCGIDIYSYDSDGNVTTSITSFDCSTVTGLLTALETVVDFTLQSNPKHALISGTLLRAFGADVVTNVDDIHEEGITAEFNEEALTQWQNASLGLHPANNINPNTASDQVFVSTIFDGYNYIPCVIGGGVSAYKVQGTESVNRFYLNTEKNSVDALDVLTLTRLIASPSKRVVLTSIPWTEAGLTSLSCNNGVDFTASCKPAWGFEVVSFLRGVTLDTTGQLWIQTLNSTSLSIEGGHLYVHGQTFGLWGKFDYMPKVKTIQGFASNTASGPAIPIGTRATAMTYLLNYGRTDELWDVRNDGEITSEMLCDFHLAAQRSLMFTPAIYKDAKWTVGGAGAGGAARVLNNTTTRPTGGFSGGGGNGGGAGRGR